MKKSIPNFLTAIAFCAASLTVALPAQAQSRGNCAAACRYMDQTCNKAPLRTCSIGVEAVSLKGDTILAYNQLHKLTPASNVKLITTGTALHSLGGDFRLTTTLAYSGKVEDGVLKGDLYIIGGGDPTIGAIDNVSIKTDSLFGRWLKGLKAAGIKSIDGRVIGDGRYFGGDRLNPSWSYDDAGYNYGAPSDALSFYENEQSFTISPGKTVGSPIKWTATYPVLPWMHYMSSATTSAAGKGDQTWYEDSPFGPYGCIRGHYAIGRGAGKLRASNKFGSHTCAFYFAQFLIDHGMPVSKGYASTTQDGKVLSDIGNPLTDQSAPSVSDLIEVCTTESSKLKTIVRRTNEASDNFYAETMMRMQGRLATGSSSYDSCLVAIKDVFEDLGVDESEGYVQVDGSGLSRRNSISPDFFVRFLSAMTKSPAYKDYLASLPQPGTGTLTHRLQAASGNIKARIHMKSGSMSGVRCFSGYIIASNSKPEDTICFSVMVNDAEGVPASELYSFIDKLITLMAAAS